MTDYLADVVMPPPELDMPAHDEADGGADEEVDRIMDEQLDISPPSGRDTDIAPEVIEEEDPIPKPVKKPKIPQEEMFQDSALKGQVKSILEGASPHSNRKTKQTRQKRGPATPEQLERLARGRQKAAENREIKKKLKEEQMAKDKADKDLVEAVREKERKKLRAKLEEPISEKPTPEVKVVTTEKVVEKGYSQQDLDDAVQRAVEQSVNRVEVLRKQRKAEKQKAQAKAEHDKKVFREINSALKRTIWDDCFI
jgi:hypothetical protein